MHLTNVVVQANLACSIDLRALIYRLSNARYDPRSFSGLIWQHRKIGGNCLLFSNGTINCNGKCLSIQEARRRLRRYARVLQRMGYAVRLTQIRIVTASAVHQLSGRIDPRKLPMDFSYEPEIFPAVMFRRNGVHYICHLSGKLMITGLKCSRDCTKCIPFSWRWSCTYKRSSTTKWTRRTYTSSLRRNPAKYTWLLPRRHRRWTALSPIFRIPTWHNHRGSTI